MSSVVVVVVEKFSVINFKTHRSGGELTEFLLLLVLLSVLKLLLMGTSSYKTNENL